MNRSIYGSAIFAAFFVFSFKLSSAFASQPAWSIGSLTRHISQHDGPNCFNAVLVAKGYVDSLRYVGELEFLYHLDNFCEVQTGPAKPGDVVVFLDAFPEHAALVLEKGRVFEKTSASGAASHAPAGGEKPGHYEIKLRSESPYFSGLRGDFKIQTYTCLPQSEVRARLGVKDRSAVVVQIENLQRRIDLGCKAQNVTALSELGEDVTKLAKLLAQIAGDAEDDVYVVARAQSVSGALDAALIEANLVFVSEVYEDSKNLRQEVSNLSRRVRMR